VTLADRIAEVLERKPLPVCVLATTVQKQKAEVIAALNANPERFVHNGLKARASRWNVRREVTTAVATFNEPAVTFPPDYDRAEEALVKLIRQGRECPYEALLRVVCAVNA
jgi:hypothetical protein